MWFENQFPYFLWMTLCGAGIMFLYDFLRISRKMVKSPAFVVNLEDILFWACAAVLVFYVTYAKNSGEIRWQTLGGMALGCGLYMAIIKDRFVRAFCAAWRFILKIIGIVLHPIVIVLQIILKPARLILWYSGRGVRRIGRRVKIKGARAKIGIKRAGFILRKK